MRPRRYSDKLIKKAIKMRKDGYTQPDIIKKLGFANINAVWYYTCPGARAKRSATTMKYYHNNKKRIFKRMKTYRVKWLNKTKQK